MSMVQDTRHLTDSLEAVLRRLRDSAIDPQFAKSLRISDHRAARSTLLADIKLAGEGEYGWDEFYHWPFRTHYSRSEERLRAPDFFYMHTEDRLGFVANVAPLLDALAGLQVGVSEYSAWRWDRVNLRANGRARYVPRYGFLVVRGHVYGAFDPKPLLAATLARTCAARDPRADEHLFDFQEDRGSVLFSAYRWTPTGFAATAGTKDSAERARTELFPDCDCRIERIGDGSRRLGWRLDVNFPG